MITICEGGWDGAPRHPRLVMKDDGVPDRVVSHGICMHCVRVMFPDAVPSHHGVHPEG